MVRLGATRQSARAFTLERFCWALAMISRTRRTASVLSAVSGVRSSGPGPGSAAEAAGSTGASVRPSAFCPSGLALPLSPAAWRGGRGRVVGRVAAGSGAVATRSGGASSTTTGPTRRGGTLGTASGGGSGAAATTGFTQPTPASRHMPATGTSARRASQRVRRSMTSLQSKSRRVVRQADRGPDARPGSTCLRQPDEKRRPVTRGRSGLRCCRRGAELCDRPSTGRCRCPLPWS